MTKSNKKRSRKSSQTFSNYQPLEPRQLMAADFGFQGASLAKGAASPDIVAASSQAVGDLNGDRHDDQGKSDSNVKREPLPPELQEQQKRKRICDRARQLEGHILSDLVSAYDDGDTELAADLLESYEKVQGLIERNCEASIRDQGGTEISDAAAPNEVGDYRDDTSLSDSLVIQPVPDMFATMETEPTETKKALVSAFAESTENAAVADDVVSTDYTPIGKAVSSRPAPTRLTTPADSGPSNDRLLATDNVFAQLTESGLTNRFVRFTAF